MDLDDEAFEAALAAQRAARRVRFERTVSRLREIGLPIDDQIARARPDDDDALGRPTIARALIAAGFATSVEDAFRRLIGWGGPAYVPREGMGPREAIEAIRAAGGVPVLAHFSEAPSQMPLLRELIGSAWPGSRSTTSRSSRETVTLVGAVAVDARTARDRRLRLPRRHEPYAEAHASLNVARIGRRRAPGGDRDLRAR